MTTFFWSDTHFNHEGIAVFCPHTRKYKTVERMNEWLIELWNKKVGKRDRIYLLGDLGFNASYEGTTPLEEIFQRLNGVKILVRGNHDEKNKRVLLLPWADEFDLVTVKDNGMRAVCCHYPLETWNHAHDGYLMLHGHSHGSLKRVIPHRFDVGVDAEGFLGPLTFEELWERGKEQTFKPADHHGG